MILQPIGVCIVDTLLLKRTFCLPELQDNPEKIIIYQ